MSADPNFAHTLVHCTACPWHGKGGECANGCCPQCNQPVENTTLAGFPIVISDKLPKVEGAVVFGRPLRLEDPERN